MRRGDYKSDEAYALKRRRAWVSFVGDVADWLRVTPGFCAMYRIGGIKKHDGFSGACGVVVGICGMYKVWGKVATE